MNRRCITVISVLSLLLPAFSLGFSAPQRTICCKTQHKHHSCCKRTPDRNQSSGPSLLASKSCATQCAVKGCAPTVEHVLVPGDASRTRTVDVPESIPAARNGSTSSAYLPTLYQRPPPPSTI